MPRARLLAAAAAAVAATLAAALPSLDYGFVYDDVAVVVQRPPLWEVGVGDFLATVAWGSGRHATLLSLDLDRWWAGTLDPAAYHASNLAFASLLAALFVALAARLGMGANAAAASAVLFALHPTHVDAVASIVGRAELLAAIGALVAVVASLDRAARAPTGRDTGRAAIVALATFFALHSKESALALPLLLVAARALLGPRVRIVAAVAGATVGVAAWALHVQPWSQVPAYRFEFVDNPLAHVDALSRVRGACWVLLEYASLVVAPIDLRPDRSYATTAPTLVQGWIGVVAWLGAGAALLRLGRKRPVMAFALAWFPLAFAVTGNVAVATGTIMAERLLLLPSVGPCLAAGLLLDPVLKEASGIRSRLGWALVAVAAVFFFVQFRDRQSVWISPAVYFRAAAQASPDSAKAHYGLGLLLMSEKNRLDAEASFRRALDILPSFSRANFQLAESMAARGDHHGASEAYLAYLATTPKDANAMINLVRTLSGAGRYEEAKAWAERAVSVAPGDALAIDALVSAEAALERRARPSVLPVNP